MQGTALTEMFSQQSGGTHPGLCPHCVSRTSVQGHSLRQLGEPLEPLSQPFPRLPRAPAKPSKRQDKIA